MKITKIITLIIITFIIIYNIYILYNYLQTLLNNQSTLMGEGILVGEAIENFPISYPGRDYDDNDDNDRKYDKGRYIRLNRKRAPKQY